MDRKIKTIGKAKLTMQIIRNGKEYDLPLTWKIRQFFRELRIQFFNLFRAEKGYADVLTQVGEEWIVDKLDETVQTTGDYIAWGTGTGTAAKADTALFTEAVGSTWAASTAYALDALVIPTSPDKFGYKCTTAGTSGTAEPTWPTTVGATVTDNTVVWTCYEVRTVGTRSQSATDKIRWVGTLTSAIAQTITNAGNFTAANGGTLIVHSDFTGVALNAGEGIQFQWNVEIT